VKVSDLLGRAGQERMTARTQCPQKILRDRLVASAESRDREHGADDRGGRKSERHEPVSRAHPEGKRDDRDDDERGEHAPEPRTPPTLRVQPGLREDQHHDQEEEGQPVGLDAPEHAPQRISAAVVELT
jgi:hypothetical protein